MPLLRNSKPGKGDAAAVDPRSRVAQAHAKARWKRALEAHRLIPLAGFASTDYHIIMTTRGDFLALWETEGVDSSCLSQAQIEEHHRQLTQALNESDQRLIIHTYFIKDRVEYQAEEQVVYRDEVANAVDGARNATLAEQTYFSTRIVYCLEWKTPFQVASTWIQKLKPLLGDAIKIWDAASRRRLMDRTQILLGMTDPAVNAGEKDFLVQSNEFADAAEAFFARLRRIKIAETVDASAAEGVGAASLEFVKLKGVDAFDFYSRLWNWDGVPSPFLKSADSLAHFIAAKSEVDFGRHDDAVVSGSKPITLYTVRGLRDPVEFDVTRHFRNIPAQMVIHTRYKPMGIDESTAFLSTRYTNAKRMGGWKAMDPMKKKRMEDMKEALDDSVRRPFGHWSCCIAVAGDDLEDLKAKRRLVEMAGYQCGAVLHLERMNMDFAWLSLWPNNHVFDQFHRLSGQGALSAAALMPYRMPEGYGKRPPSGSVFPEPLCTLNSYTLEGGSGAPSRVWIGVSDLNYFTIFGRSGTGKSFLVNFFFSNWGRYAGTDERPVGLKRWIIDRGHSYKPLCEVMGGAYVNVADPASPAKMNPLDMPPEELRSKISSLTPFIVMLMTATATSRIEFDEKDTAAINRAIQEMAFDIERRERRGSLTLLAEKLKGSQHLFDRLRPWLPAERGATGGEFSHIFPDEKDGFGANDFTVFNFDSNFVGPSTEGPIMSYILTKMNDAVEAEKNRGVRKLLFIDEAAIAITPRQGDWKSESMTAQLRGSIRKALKDWRKYGGALGLATQEPRDLQFDTALMESIRMGVPTRIFLPQAATKALLDPDEGFGLDKHLAEALNDLPKGVFLMDQRGARRFLHLKVDPTSYAIYTTDPVESKFRAAYLKEHPITPDNPAFKVFREIGNHIQEAKASGNKVAHLERVA